METKSTNYKQTINFTPELITRLNELLTHYPADKKKSALLPVLHEVQDAHDNWLSVELQEKVAEFLELKPIEVFEVVTFYTMYNQKPVGKYMFEFCSTSCCMLRGSDDLIDYTCVKLGIQPGQTTPDGMFSVAAVQCLGACGYAPMMQIGDYYHEHLTPQKIDQIIEDCKAGKIIIHDK
ncbi:NAD(P)H-dependent oxidoreductase subunit E [Flavobacterium agricola]|uniref:NAD(P)H-dependent oxidoreductase subunit E n=1 Tax=Flavobacterium agricola TaxID=2870839 RepID=A0ABY6M1W7_9FLAO|nr:NAD(P)H-dependent oxidoreductase subunit E [Flavobacterium agricola]UYW01228.1 NAD(P)H-dependent oxidoreductase subunit E [Flavobacterium agricola]